MLPATVATTNQVINGSFNVAGGDGDPTLFFTNAINNAVVKFADGSQGDVTSGGQTVRFHYVNPTLIIGYCRCRW